MTVIPRGWPTAPASRQMSHSLRLLPVNSVEDDLTQVGGARLAAIPFVAGFKTKS